MARRVIDTGSNGIALELEYDAVRDETGGAITADTTHVLFPGLEAWVNANGYPFFDSSNKLEVSGGWITDDDWSNIDIPTTSGRRKLKNLGSQRQAIQFGSSPGSYNFTLKLTGVNAAGTLSGSWAQPVPIRPYHAPATPGVTLSSGGAATVSGRQNNISQDYYWAQLDWRLETNGTFADWYMNASTSTLSRNLVTAIDSQYRVAVRAKNANGTGSYGYSGYFYTTPATVTNLTSVREGAGVRLNWTAAARYKGAILVERAAQGGIYQTVATLNGSTTNWFDSGATRGTVWYHRIRVQSPEGVNVAVSPASNIVSVTDGYGNPMALTFAEWARLGDTQFRLGVSGLNTDPNSAAFTTGWQYRTIVNGVFGTWVNVSAAITTVSVAGPGNEAAVEAEIRAFNNAGASTIRRSNTLYTSPAIPTFSFAGRVTPVSATVRLERTDSTNVGTATVVESAASSTGPWSTLVVESYPGPDIMTQLQVTGSRWYRMLARTPNGIVSLPSSPRSVGIGLYTDKTKIPGVDTIMLGEDRLRLIYAGAARLWVDGDD